MVAPAERAWLMQEAKSGTPTSKSGVDGPHSFHWSHDPRDEERIKQMMAEKEPEGCQCGCTCCGTRE